MTSLQITPNWKNKTAKFKGTIAAGEHVAVSIANDDNYITDTTNLRLRVVNPANGKTLAQFPMPEPEEDDEEEVLPSSETPAEGEVDWASDLTPLYCILNLNTDRMLMAVPPAANVPLLFVLDDYEGKTLYFKDMCEVTHWPRRVGEEEPTNLDDYKDLIEDFRERIDAAEDSIRDKVDEANGIVAYVTAAKEVAQTAATNANTAKSVAQTAASNAADAKTAAETAQGKAEDAQAAAEAARDAINEPTDDFTEEGVAVDAKAVGDALDLKADKATTYTKTQTDTKIADAISAVKDSAPEAFDTLKEIADWIGDDQSGAAAMAAAIANKVDKVSGKGLSTNDYTTAEKDKLSGVEAGAKDNVVEAAGASAFPQQGVTGKVYVAKDENKTYRWDGSQYVQIGGSSIDIVAPSTDPAAAGAAADAKATGDAVTLTPVYSQTPTYKWKILRSTSAGVSNEDVTSQVTQPWFSSGDGWSYNMSVVPGDSPSPANGYFVLGSDENSTSLSWEAVETTQSDDGIVYVDYSATRVRTDIVGYVLGSQSDKELQPKGDYALLAQLYEAVRNLAPDFTAESYAVNDLCTYNGVFYRCKSAITGTASTPPPEDPEHWEAKKVSELFLPLTGGTVNDFLSFDNCGIIASDAGGAYLHDLLGVGMPMAYFSNIIMTANGNSTAYAKPSDIGIPAFSTAKTYALGAKVVYDNALWNCTTAVSTAGAWTGTTNWAKLFDLDTGAPASGGTKLITNGQVHTALQDKADADDLRYDLVTITTGQLQDRVVQKVVLNAASTTLVLPALTDLSGKVSDFGIDMVNGYVPSDTPTAATFQLDGTIGTDYNLIVPKGETWSDMTALAAGEMAAYYFTRSAFQNGDIPTWEVVKKVVEFVPVPSTP